MCVLGRIYGVYMVYNGCTYMYNAGVHRCMYGNQGCMKGV
jgi:hypothetical protein